MSDQLTPAYFQNRQIVVIDDDESSLEIAEMLLEHAGATVTLAENGAVGLAQIRAVQPDLVVCDLSMPVMDGWALIEALRGDPAYQTLIVVALTAHAMMGDRQRILAAGFSGYLTKPIDPHKFVDHLLAAIQPPAQRRQSGES